MTDDLHDLIPVPSARSDRPLSGQTVLVVEDSRFASEAMRLLCLRSGARIRRADCLHSARRHLRVYRPQVAVIDLGLPDGLGDTLIAELARAVPRVPVILGCSGDDGARARVIEAGADGFLAKPVTSLATFQQAITAHLPDGGPPGIGRIPDEPVRPDGFAFREDMVHAAEVLAAGADAQTLHYLAQFLAAVARDADDRLLEKAADGLALCHRDTGKAAAASARISGLVQARIAARGPV